jgi:putative SOS response-associated peptidase YedK
LPAWGFCFRLVWSKSRRSPGERIDSCAILTTGANDLAATVHNRMPVIVRRLINR